MSLLESSFWPVPGGALELCGEIEQPPDTCVGGILGYGWCDWGTEFFFDFVLNNLN